MDVLSCQVLRNRKQIQLVLVSSQIINRLMALDMHSEHLDLAWVHPVLVEEEDGQSTNCSNKTWMLPLLGSRDTLSIIGIS